MCRLLENAAAAGFDEPEAAPDACADAFIAHRYHRPLPCRVSVRTISECMGPSVGLLRVCMYAHACTLVLP